MQSLGYAFNKWEEEGLKNGDIYRKEIYIFGSDEDANLGVGGSGIPITYLPTPVRLATYGVDTMDAELVPVTDSGYPGLIFIKNGEAYFCGANQYGEAGIGTVTQAVRACTKVTSVPVGRKVVKGFYGNLESFYLLDNGECWGCGEGNKLGTGEAQPTLRQSTLIKMALNNVIDVLQTAHANIAVTAEGKYYIMGSSDGRLGYYDGVTYTGVAMFTPREIPIPADAKEVIVLYSGISYIANDGTFWYAGGERPIMGKGLLSDGYIIGFTQIDTVQNVKQVISMSGTMYYLQENGDVYASGYYIYKGDGTGTSNPTGVVKIAISDVDELIQDVRSSPKFMFKKKDGTYWILGETCIGTLLTPTQVNIASANVDKAFVGRQKIFFLMKDGSLYGIGIAKYLGIGSTADTIITNPTKVSLGTKKVRDLVQSMDAVRVLVDTTELLYDDINKFPLAGYMQHSDYDPIALALECLQPFAVEPDPVLIPVQFSGGYGSLPQFPIAMRPVTAISWNKKIYSLDNCYSSTAPQPLIVEFDTLTQTYSTCDLPVPHVTTASMICHDHAGKAWFIANQYGYTYRMNLETKAVESFLVYPYLSGYPVATQHYTATNKLFTHGCYVSATGYSGTMQAYDIATNGWSDKLASTIKRACAMSALIGTKMYINGGQADVGTDCSATESYDVVGNTWNSALASNTVETGHIKTFAPFTYQGEFNVVGYGNIHCYYPPASNIWYSLGTTPWSGIKYQKADVGDDGQVYIFAGDGTISSSVPHAYTYRKAGTYLTPYELNYFFPMSGGCYMNKYTQGAFDSFKILFDVPVSGTYTIRCTASIDRAFIVVTEDMMTQYGSGSGSPASATMTLPAGRCVIDFGLNTALSTGTLDRIEIVGTIDSMPTYVNPMQGTTYESAQMPLATYLEGMVVGMVGTDIYSVGGCRPGTTALAHTNPATGVAWSYAPVMEKLGYKFDTLTETWSTIPSSTYVKGYACGGGCNGKFYAIGGSSQSNYYTAQAYTEEYTPGGAWATKLAMTTAKTMCIGAVNVDGVFNIGGCTISSKSVITNVATHYFYSAGVNMWSTNLAIPTARSRATAIAQGDKINVFGGRTGTTFSATTGVYTQEVYSISGNTWGTALTINANVLQKGRNGRPVIINGAICLVGVNLNVCRLNPLTSTWEETSEFCINQYMYNQGSVSDGTFVYNFGGAKSWTNASGSMTLDDSKRTIVYADGYTDEPPKVSEATLKQNCATYIEIAQGRLNAGI